MSDTKRCSKCDEVRASTEFYRQRSAKDGRHPYCKRCSSERGRRYYAENTKSVLERTRQWREANVERKRETDRRWALNNPERVLAYKLKSDRKRRAAKLGVSREVRDRMLFAQGGSCKICRRHESEFDRELCLDHCHVTGRVRGLLCNPCNRGLGSFRDIPAHLRAAADYLEAAQENLTNGS